MYADPPAGSTAFRHRHHCSGHVPFHSNFSDERIYRAAADFDFDGDTDLRDLASFLTCYTGTSGGTIGACCGVFDSGADQDVDDTDWVAFRAAMGGPG